MKRLGEPNEPGWSHLKVHTFRILTAGLAWGLVVAAFYHKPELLTSVQRVMQRGIEAMAMPFDRPGGTDGSCFEKSVA